MKVLVYATDMQRRRALSAAADGSGIVVMSASSRAEAAKAIKAGVDAVIVESDEAAPVVDAVMELSDVARVAVVGEGGQAFVDPRVERVEMDEIAQCLEKWGEWPDTSD